MIRSMILLALICSAFAAERAAAQGPPRKPSAKPQTLETLNLQEKHARWQYAIADARAAKAAADEAKSRVARDQEAYNLGKLFAAEFSTSLAVKQRLFYEYSAKRTVAAMARHDYVQAVTLFWLQVTSQADAAFIKGIAAVQGKKYRVDYAFDDARAAKAAADEANARAARDQEAYNRGGLSAAELSASLAAKEKFRYDHAVKEIAVRIARIEWERAKLLLKEKLRDRDGDPRE